MEMKKRNSRKCDVCKTDVHRASFLIHLKSRILLKNEKNFPQSLFDETNVSKITRQTKYILRSLKRESREKIVIVVR